MAENKQHCWPGYEPVPGKKPGTQGSCRPKAKSKTGPKGKSVQRKRRRQLDAWQEAHPGTRKSAAQHLHGPSGTTKKRSTKKSTRKTATKSTRATKPTRATKTTRATKSTRATKTARGATGRRRTTARKTRTGARTTRKSS
jgi:hypothetical protein